MVQFADGTEHQSCCMGLENMTKEWTCGMLDYLHEKNKFYPQKKTYLGMGSIQGACLCKYVIY